MKIEFRSLERLLENSLAIDFESSSVSARLLACVHPRPRPRVYVSLLSPSSFSIGSKIGTGLDLRCRRESTLRPDNSRQLEGSENVSAQARLEILLRGEPLRGCRPIAVDVGRVSRNSPSGCASVGAASTCVEMWASAPDVGGRRPRKRAPLSRGPRSTGVAYRLSAASQNSCWTASSSPSVEFVAP